ncbi:MAG: FMN-binding protein [Bacteroidaceae bacterium]|jgi:electron transport complex protein RnfG|nr:FMN-binding protein [Bacteroidaceae bacterium]
MKKALLMIALCCGISASAADDKVMTQQPDGTYVINSTTLCNVRGYRATTPVEVYIQKGKIVKVVALPNKETKQYFEKITTGLLPRYTSLKVAKAKRQAKVETVDACTGATFSCKAVQKNISAALDYYEANK